MSGVQLAGGQIHQQVTSASSKMKPTVLLASKGAEPVAQSMSATPPQLRRTTWWLLSATHSLKRAGGLDPADELTVLQRTQDVVDGPGVETEPRRERTLAVTC